MLDPPSDRCGYTWPSNHKIDDDPNQQSCCWRPTLKAEADRCALHADPNNTGEKTISALQELRPTKSVRDQQGIELLDGAILVGYDIGNSIPLCDISLRGSDLNQAKLSNVDLSNTDLTGSDLSDANLTNASLTNAHLADADLSDANLTNASLTNAHLAEADLSRTDFSEAYLEEAVFTNADLSFADFEGADLSFSNFKRAKLFSADLPAAKLSGADLPNTDLSRVDLSDADLSDVNLSCADLSSADLPNADLSNADLPNADLSNADLPNADLSNADLSNTDLTDANLLGVDIRESILKNIQLSAGTDLGKQKSAEAQTCNSECWDSIARSHYELKTVCDENGLINKARTQHFLERRARGYELKHTCELNPWATASWLGAFISRIFIGYGIRVRRLMTWMVILFIISTSVYVTNDIGGETAVNSLSYSVQAFTVAPPSIPNGRFQQAVVMTETFFGTLSIVLLGYVLGNREQF